MPTMVRSSKKARSILYSILGVPVQMQDSKSWYRKKYDKKIDLEEYNIVKPRQYP